IKINRVCIPNNATHTYTVTEVTPPPGYNLDATPKNCEISESTTPEQTCAVTFEDTQASIAIRKIAKSHAAVGGSALLGGAKFTNIPLSSLEVIFKSLAGAGVTTATIDCSGPEPSGVILPFITGSTNPGPDQIYGNGTTGLVPGTYNCQIVIDP